MFNLQHILLYSKYLVCVSFLVITALVHNLRALESQLSEATRVFWVSSEEFSIAKQFFLHNILHNSSVTICTIIINIFHSCLSIFFLSVKVKYFCCTLGNCRCVHSFVWTSRHTDFATHSAPLSTSDVTITHLHQSNAMSQRSKTLLRDDIRKTGQLFAYAAMRNFPK